MTLTNPPEDRPNSALAPSLTTTSSCTASRLNVNAGRWPPRCSPKNGLLKSAPSTEMLLLIPFCPFTLISSPSGPCTIVTPGVSCMKLRKFRPLFGRPRSDALSMSVDSSALVGHTAFDDTCRGLRLRADAGRRQGEGENYQSTRGAEHSHLLRSITVRRKPDTTDDCLASANAAYRSAAEIRSSSSAPTRFLSVSGDIGA